MKKLILTLLFFFLVLPLTFSYNLNLPSRVNTSFICGDTIDSERYHTVSTGSGRQNFNASEFPDTDLLKNHIYDFQNSYVTSLYLWENNSGQTGLKNLCNRYGYLNGSSQTPFEYVMARDLELEVGATTTYVFYDMLLNDTFVTEMGGELRLNFTYLDLNNGNEYLHFYLVNDNTSQFRAQIGTTEDNKVDYGQSYNLSNNVVFTRLIVQAVAGAGSAEVEFGLREIYFTNISPSSDNLLPFFNVTYNNTCFNDTKGEATFSYDIDAFDNEGNTIYYGYVSCDQFCRQQTLQETFSVGGWPDTNVFYRGNLIYNNSVDVLTGLDIGGWELFGTHYPDQENILIKATDSVQGQVLVIETKVPYWAYAYSSAQDDTHDFSLKFGFSDIRSFEDPQQFNFLPYGSNGEYLFNMSFNYTKDRDLIVKLDNDEVYNAKYGTYPEYYVTLLNIFAPTNNTPNVGIQLSNSTTTFFNIYHNISFHDVKGFVVENIDADNTGLTDFFYVVDDINYEVWDHTPTYSWDTVSSGTFTTNEHTAYQVRFYVTDSVHLQTGEYKTYFDTVTMPLCQHYTNEGIDSMEGIVPILGTLNYMLGSDFKAFLKTIGMEEEMEVLLWWFWIFIFFGVLLGEYFVLGKVDVWLPLFSASGLSFWISWLIGYTAHMISFLIILGLSLAILFVKLFNRGS